MKAFLTGIAMGVGLGFLFAPDRGVVTRGKLRDQLGDWSQSASNQIDRITSAAERSARKKDQGSERGVVGDEGREERGHARQVGSESTSDADTLNSATREELMEVNGIGPILADKIIAGRPYSSFNELLERGILPHGPFEELQRQLKTRPRRSA
jgi:DNA uptake protein ComE-like DNA-binding protein